MVERGWREHCDDCIDRNRMSLIILARQYIPRDHWLHNPRNGMRDDYSLMAIHAMGRRIDLDKFHLDIRAPFLRETPEIEGEEQLLSAIKSQITDGTFDTDAIRTLQAIAKRRQFSFSAFLNKGKSYWDQESERAKPFLDQLVHPDPADPHEKRERLQRVYWLDQGAFILAKTALAGCTGPWVRLCPYGEKFQRFHPPSARNLRS